MRKGQGKSKKIRMGYARVVGEQMFDLNDFRSRGSDPAHRFAKRRKKNPTPAEREFKQIINTVYNGFLAGSFERERAICGKWILDFYFPKYRLAIEIDGSFHNQPEQIDRDAEKAADCKKLEITLIRFTNQEVFGDRASLVEKLKCGLAEAKAGNCAEKNILPDNEKQKVGTTVVQLTKHEKDLIRQHFEFYKSLANGKRQPTTVEQKHFVAVCRGETLPETEHEIAFAKFIRIQKIKLKK